MQRGPGQLQTSKITHQDQLIPAWRGILSWWGLWGVVWIGQIVSISFELARY